MKIVVFTGPTLSPVEAREVLDATYLPPAGQGDVYRAALERPFAIGLIDGYFERVPAVWHKELLWALSQGIHVFGSASMGALRAAELERYGMEGVGAIFRAVLSGELTDDDEVALVHGDEASGFLPLSEPMVNIRCTLAAARARGVIGEHTRLAVERIAKALHFPERCYPLVLAAARRASLDPAELDALELDLRAHRVDQKRADALAMLAALADLRARDPGPKEVAFAFENTDAWAQVVRDNQGRANGSADDSESLLAELRLQGGSCARVVRGAMLRAVARDEAVRRGLRVTEELLFRTEERFRSERGLVSEDELVEYLARSGLTRVGLRTLLAEEACLGVLEALYRADAGRHVVSELRASGEYPALRERALEKQELLSAHGLAAPTLLDAGLTEEELVRWYLVDRLGRSLPRQPAQQLRELGIAEQDALRREALREFVFLELRRAASAPPREAAAGSCG